MAFNIQTSDARENFRTAAHLIAQANGLWKKDATGKPLLDKSGNPVADISQIDLQQLTQGYLFTMCDVNPQTQQMQFSMVDTQQVSGSPINPNMRLLSMQDSFVVSTMSYFLMVVPYNTSQQYPNYTADRFQTPITYSSTYHDNELDGVGLELMDTGMTMFWAPGAYISIEVDKKVVIPYWDCLKHLYVPQTQANASPNIMGGPPFQWPKTQDQYDGATDGFYPVEPTVIFGGGRQNIVKLNLPANVPSTIAPFNNVNYGAATNDGFIVKACLKFNGILAQNSTSVR